jgi:hypothetical protein
MNRREGPPDPDAFAPQVVFDYHRTLVGYHGTSRQTADHLVDGGPFTASTNDDDWLGHGIYFWEYAPLQAWAWAERRYGTHAAVVGAMIRLGRCLDLLDPQNLSYVDAAHQKLQALGRALPNNANTHKFLDCVVFNYLYDQFGDLGYNIESCRAVYVVMAAGKLERLWTRSGVFRNGHIQLCIREPRNILAVWHVRRDGRYGKAESEKTVQKSSALIAEK